MVRAALVTALLVAGPVDGRPPRSAGAPTAPEAPSQSGSASSGAATGQTTPQRREQLEQLAKSLMTAAMVARTATRLTVAAPLLAPNGDAAGVAAFVSNDTFAYFVHAGSDLCGQVTFDESEPVTAGSGWRISGEILESSAEQLTARIDWQRLWERGQRLADGPRGSTRLTLRRNDRVPLDYIAAAGATKQCDRVGLGLDITAERHAVFNTTRSVTDAEFDAELWLLRNRDGQQPAVLYQRVRTRSGGAGFVFRPARDAADQSPYAVEITGRIQSARQSDGTPGMFVGLERLFRNLSPEGTSPRGGSGRTIALPAPDDVISFDLPSSSASPGTGGGGGVGVAGARAGGGGGGMLGGQGGAGTGGAAGGGRGRPAPDQRAGAVTSAPPPTLSLRMRLVPAGRLPGTDNPGS